MAARERRGYALIVALVLIALLILGGALMVQELVTRANLLRAETNELHLQSVLDSSVSRIMATYKEDPGHEGQSTLAIDGGEATLDAEILSPDRRRVEIAADYHGLRRRIEIELLVEIGHPVRLVDWRPVIGSAS